MLSPPRYCRALGCVEQIGPRLLMCPRHWAMVPAQLKRAIFDAIAEGHLGPGGRPTRAYRAAVVAAAAEVKRAELARRPALADAEGGAP